MSRYPSNDLIFTIVCSFLQLIVCGDIRGNLLLFSSPRALLNSTSATTEVKASPVNYFKGAHGVSSVNSVSISSLSSDEIEIRSV